MENIENRKKKYTNIFSDKYSLASKDYTCSSVSEIWAYIDSVIPEEHGKYSIFDFDGCVISDSSKDREDNRVISPSIAIYAKNKICRYCWKMEWEEINNQRAKDPDNIKKFLRKRAEEVMNERLESGGNLVIFGASQRPIGRTMLAAIVMREAIKLRLDRKKRWHTYDWVDFATLVSAIEKDEPELNDYRSCTWLVVDNITTHARTQEAKTYIIDRIDPFFIGRYKDKLPTILVFKFDIRNESLLMEKTFGVGIERIIKSKKRTFRIPLSEEFLAK